MTSTTSVLVDLGDAGGGYSRGGRVSIITGILCERKVVRVRQNVRW